jgi:hypothetical protein
MNFDKLKKSLERKSRDCGIAVSNSCGVVSIPSVCLFGVVCGVDMNDWEKRRAEESQKLIEKYTVIILIGIIVGSVIASIVDNIYNASMF